MADGLSLKPENWHDFKTKWTNENALIAEVVAALLPRDDCDLILDVGAGIGDIAALAYPEIKAILLDVLPFEPSTNPSHRRVLSSFFDFFAEKKSPISLLLFSHSLQYLDDDISLLFQHIHQIDALYIMEVTDDETPFQQKAVAWLEAQGLSLNVERKIPGFPGGAYQRIASRSLCADIRCWDFRELARQLGCMIYDASLSDAQIDAFSAWLAEQLPEPVVSIPQVVTLYKKK